MVATAIAEMDRPAPSDRRDCPVEALTLTLLDGETESDRRAPRASPSRWPASRGRAATIVRSIETGRQPAALDASADLGERSALAIPRGVRAVGREEPTEIAQTGRPEERVGDCVERDIAVRMTVEPRGAGDRDTTEHQRRAGSERMAVVPDAGPDGARSGDGQARPRRARDRPERSP